MPNNSVLRRRNSLNFSHESSSIEESKNKVTISLYRLESEDGKFNPAISAQDIVDIQKIRNRLTEEARDKGDLAPIFEVCVAVIPDYEHKSDDTGLGKFNSENHKKASETLVNDLSEKLGENVIVSDFVLKCNADELEYMDGLTAAGSVADMIKTRSIIDNEKYNHLNIDSNTKILDYKKFYGSTFGESYEEQKDGLQALSYTKPFASANNKVVYTPKGNLNSESLAGSKIRKHIKKCYYEHIKECKKDEVTKKENQIYEKAFRPGVVSAGLAINFELVPGKPKVRADLKKSEYFMTRHIIPAVQMSWSNNELSVSAAEKLKSLKKIAPIKEGDADFDYSAFVSTAKKHTYDSKINGEREDLLGYTDIETDMKLCYKFIKQVENTELYNDVIAVIPKTELGEKFAASLLKQYTLTPEGS